MLTQANPHRKHVPRETWMDKLIPNLVVLQGRIYQGDLHHARPHISLGRKMFLQGSE